MRRGTGRLAFLLGIVWMVLVFGGSAPPNDDAAKSGEARPADPYSRFVKEYFIRSDPQLLLGPIASQPNRNVVELLPEASPEALRFAELSHLRRDILANDPGIWEINNGLVTGIVPWRYQDPPPTIARRAWTGALVYRPAFEAAGTNKELRPILLDAIAPDFPGIALTATLRTVSTGKQSADIFKYSFESRRHNTSSAPRDHQTASRFDLMCDPEGAEVPVFAARLVRVGQEIAVKSEGNCAVKVGRTKLEARQWFALPRGARLTVIGLRGREYGFARRTERDERRLVSWYSRAGKRLSDPAIATWATAAAREYERARLAQPTVSNRDDVELSLDADLQSRLQKMLDDHMKDLGALPISGRPRVAAVTILDALTGEVLAMAGHDDNRAAVAAAGRLAVDPNLQLLPIGSTAKPLFAAAILATNPRLGDLCVENIKDTGVLGHEYVGGPQETAVGKTSFERFIEVSSNGYMAALILLGSPEQEPSLKTLKPGERFSLDGGNGSCNGQAQRSKSIYDNPDERSDLSLSDQTPEWANRLGQIFQVNIGQLGKQDGDSGCPAIDAAPWYGVSGDNGLCQFDASTPRREGLHLIGRRQFQANILSAALGGGEGRWSAVKLAEAYARAVVGTPVRATFAVNPKRLDLFPEDLYPAEVRSKLTAAMSKVVTGRGGTGSRALPGITATAAALKDKGLLLGQFGKTGTASLPNVKLDELDTKINKLFGDCVDAVFDSEKRAVLSLRRSARCRLKISEDVRERFEKLALEQRALAPERQPRPRGKGAGGIFVFSDGRPTSVSPLRMATTPNTTAKLFAIVVAAYARGISIEEYAPDARGNPLAAFALVVNFSYEKSGPGNAAARFAGDVVRDILKDRLLAAPTSPVQ